MVAFFQKLDGLTVLDRMCAYRRLIALHQRLKTFAEPELSGAKEIGQFIAAGRHDFYRAGQRIFSSDAPFPSGGMNFQTLGV